MANKKHQRGRLQLNVAIVGAGKVGSVLGRILVENGDNIVAVVSKTKASAIKAGKYLRCRSNSTSLEDIPPSTDLIFIATPHSAVGEVAASLASLRHLDFKRLSVCHASGMLTAEALEPLRRRGATVFSFHPLQTFPRDFEPADILESARSIYYGVDGSPKAIRIAKKLATALSGKAISIPPEMRAYYHAACVVASNHLTAMMSVIDVMFRNLSPREKSSFEVFKPIMKATLENVERTSPAKALSGPVARGGVETVAEHLESIAKFSPELIPYFTAMTEETVRLAVAKGSLDEAQHYAFRNLIQSHRHRK